MKDLIARSRRTLGLAAVSAFARAPGFLVPLIIAAVFGAGGDTDAYFIAYTAALLVGGTLSQAVEVAIVPYAAREAKRQGGATRALLRTVSRRWALISALLWVVVLFILSVTTPRALMARTLFYGGTFTPLVLGWAAAAAFSGALVSQWRIGIATASMLIRGLGALGGLLLAPVGVGLWGVGAGLGVGELCRLAFLRRSANGLFPVEPQTIEMHPPVTEFQRSARAQVLVGATGGISPVIERILATSLGVGAVSHLEYASRLLVVPMLLFDGAIAPLLLARWTHHVADHGKEPDRWEVIRVAGKGLLLAGGCAIVVALMAPVLVHVLLGHGRFTAGDEIVVSQLTRWLCIAFVATMGALLVERVYLAATRNQMLAGLAFARAGLRVVTVVLLLPSKGLVAFAIGYAVADWSYLVALIVFLRSRATGARAAQLF